MGVKNARNINEKYMAMSARFTGFKIHPAGRFMQVQWVMCTKRSQMAVACPGRVRLILCEGMARLLYVDMVVGPIKSHL
jgi:hypothetical protein